MQNSLPDHAISGGPGSVPPFPSRRTGSSPEGQRPSINVIGSFKRHWVVSSLVFLVLLGGGTFVLWKKVKPVYKAESTVYVSPKFPKILANDTEVDLPYDSYFPDQVQKVTRHDIIEEAITKLPSSVRHVTGPALPYEVQLLQEQIEAKRIGYTYEMSISLYGPSPDGLAEIVNSVTDTYVEKAKNEEFYGLDARLTTLHQEQDRLQKQMDDRLAEQAQLMQQLGVASISSAAGASNPYDTSSQTVRGQLAVARVEREGAEAKYAALLKGEGATGSSALEGAADEAIAADSGLSVMRSNLNSQRATLVENMNGLRPDHPIYQKDKAEIESIDSQLNELRRKASEHLQEKLRQEVTRTRMVELQLIQELGQNTHTATAAAPKFQRANELGPEIDSLQKAYDAIDDRIRELELESKSPGSIHVSTAAMRPLGPEPSKLKILLCALMFICLMCALATPVGIDLMDGRIYTPRDVERVVGFHPLGILLDDDEFRQEMSSEYYLRLAAGIDNAVRNSGARTFLFTSAGHGSGTSTIVGKLSDKLRDLDLKTLTITAAGVEEMEIPGVVPPSRSDLVVQRRLKADEMQTTAITPLTIYDYREAGRGPRTPTPNPAVRALHHARENYDVVLIDADPLPISATTEYLARITDATVLVVKSSTTTKQELDRSARLLERLEVAGVAVILNRISQDRADRELRSEFRKYEQSLRRRSAAKK